MTLADIRPGLRTLLLANANIVAAVSNRIYPVILPQGVVEDSIVYNRISESESSHYVGPTGLILMRVQIDALSQSIDSASAIADLIKEHITGFSGTISYGSNSPQSYVRVQGIFLLGGDEDYFNESTMYRRSRDYNIIFGDRNA